MNAGFSPSVGTMGAAGEGTMQAHLGGRLVVGSRPCSLARELMLAGRTIGAVTRLRLWSENTAGVRAA